MLYTNIIWLIFALHIGKQTTILPLGGTDIKSVLLNISSIVFFIFPFFAFFVSQYNGFSINDKNNIYGASIAITMALYVIAYIAPPIGWRRPHPYSDDPTNVPYTFDKKK
jgi:hypothetical protein